MLRFRGGALGSIVVSNSQKPGLFGRIHVHGETGASVGVADRDRIRVRRRRDTRRVAPPINDLWTIAGEEERLRRWQREDRDRASRIDVMTHYHRAQIEDFLDAIQEGRPPLVSGEEGRKSVEIASAIYGSQADGPACACRHAGPSPGAPPTLPQRPTSDSRAARSGLTTGEDELVAVRIW